MAKVVFNKKEDTFQHNTGFTLKKRTSTILYLEHSLYGARTWTLRTVDQKYLGSFEMWCWSRMEKISWNEHVRKKKCYKERRTRIFYKQ
jgi:hypothetical protein